MLAANRQRAAADPPCPVVATQWRAVPDAEWPLIEHRDGDSAWAHLEPARLPGASAKWCNPLEGDFMAVTSGRATYRSYCATCHGDNGLGDGPGAAVADPRPYNFTRPEFAGMREPPGPAVIFDIITRGIAGTAMNAFATYLDARQRLEVMAYISTIPGPAAISQSKAWADTLRARRH
ncbi:MAG TPA: c-type cytochrome [Gemmatimonadales bacterium]